MPGSSVQQTKSNHVRYDPLFHFFLAPGGLLLLVWTIFHLVRYPTSESAMLAAVALLTVLLTFKARLYALRVQDRVIRLEERLRLQALLPEGLRLQIPELTEAQLIALRFAADAELPELAERACREMLDKAQIKNAVREWRPDYWRV